MNKIATLITIALILLLARVATAQNVFHGTVVDIVDGRTVVLAVPDGKMTVVLQYIDVPEREQALHQVVIDHLSQLTRGKSSQFRLVGIGTTEMSGRLVIDGSDISRQMLRDGAAWLLPQRSSGQESAEYTIYKQNEDAAKAEHLGVWSIPGLKTAWEFRAEREAKLREQQAANVRWVPVQTGLGQFQTISRPQIAGGSSSGGIDKEAWLDVFAGTGTETAGIKTYDDPNGRFNAYYTSVAFVNLASKAGNQRLECRAIYALFKLVNGGRLGIYAIGFRAISDDYNFSRRRNTRLALTIDGKAVSIALHHGLKVRGSIGAEELFFYQLNRTLLQRIANAGSVQIRLDDLSGKLDPGLQALMKQLIAGT